MLTNLKIIINKIFAKKLQSEDCKESNHVV